MTPTVARWIHCIDRQIAARKSYAAAVRAEQAAWAAVQEEIDGLADGGDVGAVGVCGRGLAGVLGGAGDRGVEDDAGSKGGAT